MTRRGRLNPWVYVEIIRRPRVDGERLRRTRQAKGLSLREVARRVSISAPYLVDIEYGRRQPSAAVRERLVRVLA